MSASAVPPFRHPQNSRNGAIADGEKMKSGGAFLTLRFAPVSTFKELAVGPLWLFFNRRQSGQTVASAVGLFRQVSWARPNEGQSIFCFSKRWHSGWSIASAVAPFRLVLTFCKSQLDWKVSFLKRWQLHHNLPLLHPRFKTLQLIKIWMYQMGKNIKSRGALFSLRCAPVSSSWGFAVFPLWLLKSGGTEDSH